MGKKYGVSLRLQRLRRGLRALHEKAQAAHDGGNRKAYERCYREFFEYAVRHRNDLGIPDEQIEDLRAEMLETEKLAAELDYLEAKEERLKRELEEIQRLRDEKLLSGQIKWQ